MNIHIYISYLEELEAESVLDSLYILNSLIQFYQSVTRERAWLLSFLIYKLLDNL